MPEWKHQDIRFENKGLDLLRDSVDKPDNVYNILDNAVSVTEGSIQPRPGIQVQNNTALGGRVNSAVFINDPVNAKTATIIGAGTTLYSSSSPTKSLTTSLSANPKTFSIYRPELSESPVCYVGDLAAMTKVFCENNAWVTRKMGISPPPIAIPYSDIVGESVANLLEIEKFNTSLSKKHCTAASFTDTINLINPSTGLSISTASTYKYTISTAPAASISSVARIYNTLTSKDLDSGCSDDSLVEFALWLDKSEYISEIRIKLATQNDFTNEYFLYTIPGTELYAVTDTSSYPVDRQAVYNQVLQNSPWMTPQELDNETDNLIAQGYGTQITYQSSNVPVVGWRVISVKRSMFTKVGYDSSITWRAIKGVIVEVKYTAVGVVFAMYGLTITKSGGLNSTNGIPYKWIYSYFNATHGVESNPSPLQVNGAVLTNRSMPLSILPPSDAQVTHVKIYREGGSLGAYHLLDTVKIGSATSAPYYEVTIAHIHNQTPVTISFNKPAGLTFEGGDQILITGNTAINGWWQVVVQTSPEVGYDTTLYLLGSTVAGTMPAGGTVKTIKYIDSVADASIAIREIPRFDLDVPITTIQSRTNLLTNSEEFESSNWTKTNVTSYDMSAVAPFGGTVATKLMLTAVAAEFTPGNIVHSVVFPTSGEYTLSAYVKRVYGLGTLEVTLDGTKWEKINVKNYPDVRWDRFKYTKYITAGTYNVGFQLTSENIEEESYHVWGVMVESGHDLNEYIKTFNQTETVIDGSRKEYCLPIILGPFLGKYIFGMGDIYRPGILYWCNEQYPDNWSPLNYIEVTGPNDPLQNGIIYDGKVYIFSKESMFVVYPSMTGGNTFQVLPTSCNFGLWSRYSLTVGSKIWFLSGRGIMETVGGEAVNISQNSLIRPIFEGKRVGDYYPVDWSVTATTDYNFNLCYIEPYLYFIYKDTAGTMSMLVYHTVMQRWHAIKFPTSIAPTITYSIRQASTSSSGFETYFGATDGRIYKLTGTTDVTYNGSAQVISPITMTVALPDMAQGSSRMEKMYGDICIDADTGGGSFTCTPYTDFGNIACDAKTVTATAGRKLSVVPIKSVSRSGIYEAPISKTISTKLVSSSLTGYPIYYGIDLTYSLQEDEVRGRIMDWSDLGDPRIKYIWGAVLDIDTNGATHMFDLYADGLCMGCYPVSGAIGRRKVEVSWPVIQASFVRLVSESSEGYILYGEPTWYFHNEVGHINNWVTYWQDLADGTDSYLFAVDIEGDTHGNSKEIIVEIDGGTEVARESIILDGHTKSRITFTPVKANTARIRSIDDVSGFLYKERWISSPEPPLIEHWDTNYENDGNLDDKWISGLYMEVDTVGISKNISVYIDGSIIGSYPIVASGRHPVKISFGPVRGVTMKFTSSTVSGRLYSYRWIYDSEPVQLTNLATNWTNIDWPYEKLVKGVSIESDTGGIDKLVQVAINGQDASLVGDVITLNSDGRKMTMYNLPNVLAETVRLVSLDNNTGRLYGVKWVYDREPISMMSWETQESTFNKNTYSTIKEMYVSLRCSQPVSLFVYSDGFQDNYVVESTGGERRKVRITMRSTKSRVWKFKFISGEPFKIYVSDCVVHVKAWGESGDYSPYVLPFPGGE